MEPDKPKHAWTDIPRYELVPVVRELFLLGLSTEEMRFNLYHSRGWRVSQAQCANALAEARRFAPLKLREVAQ